MSETALEQGVDVAKGNIKKSVVMSWFASEKLKKEVAYKNQQAACGQVIGQIFNVGTRNVTFKDGSNKAVQYATGEFECMCYETGEFCETNVIYLPDYYMTVLSDTLKAMPGSATVAMGIEIMLVPTGKSIPVSYEIKNLAQRSIESPIERMKADLAKQGMLRLPRANVAALPAPEPTPEAMTEALAEDQTGEGVAEAAKAEEHKAKAASKSKAA